MYLQEVLEVAIGLIFVWMVFSIATMQIQEWFANLLNKRANDLEGTIRGMLEDPDKVSALYSHPLIKSLSKTVTTERQKEIDSLEGKNNPNWWQRLRLWWIKPKPSYIPSKNYTLALFDIVADAGTESSPIQSTLNQLRKEIDALSEGDRETAKTVLSNLYKLGKMAAESQAGSDFQKGIKDQLKNQIALFGNKYPQLSSFTGQLSEAIDNSQYNLGALFKSDQVLEQVRSGAKFLLSQNSNLGKSLNSLLAGVEEYATSTDKALAVGRSNVEEWFNNTMDRMSGWYKRWSQNIAFWVGLILALILNIDSIELARHLWREPAVRQALAANAEQFLIENTDIKKTTKGEVEPSEAIRAFQEQFNGLILPIGWDIHSWDPLKDEKNNIRKTKDDTVICMSSDVPGPIRIWNKQCTQIINLPNNFSDWILKILGLLLTAIAARQGAPFWFDILKKLVNVRETGANPAEKPKESEKPAA